jgi:signal transduction histidine kinase
MLTRTGALIALVVMSPAWSERMAGTAATSVFQRHERDDGRVLWFVIAGFWLFNVTVSGVQIYVTVRVNGSPPPVTTIMRWLLPGYSVWLVSTPAIVALTRRFGFDDGRWRSSFLVHFIASIIVAAATQVADALMAVVHDPRQRFVVVLIGMARTWGLWAVFSYWFYVVLVLAVRHYTTAMERKRREAELTTAFANAQLTALRAQLHPHFLFNTLNSISALVAEDPQVARKTIAELGELLRTTLREGARRTWSLREELALVERYVAIERMRFGERLSLRVACEPATLGAEVPTLLLQPLVENAILHGIQPALQGGTVEIAARRVGDRLELEVSDDGVGLAGDTTERVGLSNCRERLATYFGDDQTLTLERRTPTGTRVVVRLPWITAQREQAEDVVVG